LTVRLIILVRGKKETQGFGGILQGPDVVLSLLFRSLVQNGDIVCNGASPQWLTRIFPIYKAFGVLVVDVEMPTITIPSYGVLSLLTAHNDVADEARV
tara:strand:- start:16433 stop:16726 length:294 start_codon:yes stop_codon:yes gene_type:complete